MKKLILAISLVLMISCLFVACSSSEPTETNAPETTAPTNAPETSAPTNAPETSAPTNAPETTAPTNAPETTAPTNAPETTAPATEETGCTHSWAEATCTTSKVCTLCGMVEGTELGHTYGEWTIVKAPTCTESGKREKVCVACGVSEEETLEIIDHTWVEASCTAPKTCSVCNATEGEALAHAWVDATCTAPKTCSVCKATEGEALAHAWVDASCKAPKTCTTCGATEGTVAEHVYIEFRKEPTCSETGLVEKICEKCATEAEDVLETIAHTWVDATCTTPKTCSVCKATEGEVLAHTWVEATCTTPKTCSVCNVTEGYPVHVLGTDGTCEKCGIRSISMTDKEKEAAIKVKDMTYSVTEYSSEVQMWISFKDEKGYSVSAPANVDVKILDENGDTLYENTVLLKTSQYYVSVNYKDLIPAKTSTGTLCYKVYNDYFSFEEIRAEIKNLPWTVDVELPTVPQTVLYYTDASHKITNITYEVKNNNITFYGSGEKLFDKNGANYSRTACWGWKLYDSEGYVVATGMAVGTGVTVGEKFKDVRFSAVNVIEQGKSYRLELLNIG